MEEELTTKKYYRLIPVKIKDNKIVRVKEIPAFESKNIKKALLNKSNISTSTEQTAATNNIINNVIIYDFARILARTIYIISMQYMPRLRSSEDGFCHHSA